MKKILLMLVAVTAMATAGLWSTAQGFVMKQIKPDSEYTLDTNGIDPRVYEFTPKGLPNTTCVVMVLDGGKQLQMQCLTREK